MREADAYPAPMNMRCVWSAILIFVGGVSLQQARAVSLDVNLEELRGPELLEFMRAVVPEVYGGDSRKPLDLPTLALLHAHLKSNASYGTPEFQRRVRGNVRVIERLMRRELAKLDLPTLRRMTLGDGKKNFGNGHLYPALYLRLIEAEVAKVCAGPKPASAFPAGPQALPKGTIFDSMPGAHEPAVQRAISPFAELLSKAKAEKPRGIYRETEAYQKLADGILRGADKNAAGELLRFAWDSWCGTGLDRFWNDQMTLVFLSLLHERRVSEALGVSLLIGDSPEWLREPEQPFDRWRIDLFKWCGFDWEEVLIATGRTEFLAAAGSERGAKMALATFKAQKSEEGVQLWLLARVTPFLIPGKPTYWVDSDPRKAISLQTQAEIFAALDEAVREDLGLLRLGQLLDIFEDLHRDETKETLRRLLKHPSTTIVNRAAMVLIRMDERVPLVAPAPPVRFRIYLNGEPWRSVEVNYSFSDAKLPYLGSGSIKTDAEGFATIPRDDFLDPAKRGNRMRFSQFPTRGGGSRWSERAFGDPWVSGEIEVPRAFDETTAVRLTALPLPIEIEYATPPELGAKAPTRMKLVKAGQTGGNDWGYLLDFGRVSGGNMGTPPTNFTLSTIAPGDYQLLINTPGAVRHVTQPFTVAPGMAPVSVKLEKGSHVYATLAMPQNARGAGTYALYQGERDITAEMTEYVSDDRPPLFRALPRGRYQLRVLSTAEFMKKHNITEWKAPEALWQDDPSQGVDCEGLTVDFTIDDTSPPLLDLGKLEIPPVAAMKAKARGTRVIGGPAPR